MFHGPEKVFVEHQTSGILGFDTRSPILRVPGTVLRIAVPMLLALAAQGELQNLGCAQKVARDCPSFSAFCCFAFLC